MIIILSNTITDIQNLKTPSTHNYKEEENKSSQPVFCELWELREREREREPEAKENAEKE